MVSSWKTTVCPGDWVEVWAPKTPPVPNVVQLPSPLNLGSGTTSLRERHVSLAHLFWDRWYCTTIQIPATQALGAVNLFNGTTDLGLTFTVVAPSVARPVVTMTPSGGDDQRDITASLWAGNDVRLSSGVFQLNSVVPVPAGASIFGAGPGWTKVNGSGFAGKGTFSVDGLTFDDPLIGGATVVHSARSVTNCSFRGVQVWMSGVQQCVENCTFRQASLAVNGPCKVHACVFEDWGPSHAFALAPGACALVVDCQWRRTPRGITMQPWIGSIGYDNCLFAGLQFENVFCNGGGEVILIESPTTTPSAAHHFDNGMILHTILRGCLGSGLQAYWAHFRNNMVRDWYQESGNLAVDFWNVRGDAVQQHGNIFQDFELHGPTININRSWNNIFHQIAIIGPRATRGNLGESRQTYYPVKACIGWDAGGNTLTGCTFLRVPDHWPWTGVDGSEHERL